MEPLYVCVYVLEFAAQAMMRLRPELQRAAVAVMTGDPPLEQVCSANARATRLGVMQGMTRAELESFSGLCILRRSEAEERGTRSALLEAAGVFTPRIEVHAYATPAFTMVLDMTGTARIFGPVEQAVGRIASAMARLRVHVQLAASANFHAAVCVAPSACKTPSVIPAGQERTFLQTLPLEALELTQEQRERLRLWGLRTIGELAALSEVELVVRLGQDGRRLRLLARGEHPHLMVPKEPVFLLEEFLSFDSPIEVLDSLLFVLGPMLDQLLERAQSRALALASVTVRLGLDGGGEHERTIKPALPVAQREVLLKLLHLDLQAHPSPAGVASVFVHAEPGDRSKVQLGLFAPQLPEPMRLDVTLARIAALVGEERVGRARLLDTHRPDSFAMERFSVSGVASTPMKREPTRSMPLVTLRRCRPGVQIPVHQEQARPAAFALHGKEYAVCEAYGPWRRSGEWWSQDVWSQEEWDVHAVANEDEVLLCVLMHDLLRHRWQLEGLYD
jgi:protein ImuB